MSDREMGKEKKWICRKCGAEFEKNVRALNQKYFGVYITEYYCMDCLAEGFGVNVEALYKKIEYFKSLGCTLFE